MLKVLLKEDIEHLGSLGDEVLVKPGYARNFLIPQGKALSVNDSNAKVLLIQRKAIEQKRQAAIADSKSLADKIAELELLFVMKSAAGGKLFGSVTNKHILDELEKHGVVLKKGLLKENTHLKEVGNHVLPIKLHSSVRANLRIKIESASAEKAVPVSGSEADKTPLDSDAPTAAAEEGKAAAPQPTNTDDTKSNE